MNRIAFIRHLVLKDIRHQRGSLTLLWLLALLLPIIARYTHPGPFGANFYLIGCKALYAILCAVILLRVIQLDPPGRGIHFLGARPVNWLFLLTSKIFFAGAFLLIPNGIATLGAMYAIGLHFNFLDLVLFLIERTITATAFLAVIAAPAFYLRRITSAVMTLIGGVALIDITHIAVDYYLELSRSTPPTIPNESWFQLDNCRWLMLCCGLAVTGVAGAFFCYGKRPWRESYLVLGSGTVLSLLLWFYWPIDLSVLFSEQPMRVTNVAPPLRAKIHFHMEHTFGYPSAFSNFVWHDTFTRNVDLHGGLSGVDVPYFFKQIGGSAEATLRSGRKLTSSYADDRGDPGLLFEAGLASLPKLMGFTPLPRRHGLWQEESFRAFQYSPDLCRDENLSGVSIKGMVTFSIGRVFILRTFPLRGRIALNLQRRSYTLENVEADPNGINFQIVKQYMPLTLRGDLPGWNQWETLSWIVINRHRGEYLVDTIAGAYTGDLEMHHLQRPEQSKEPLPADWINGAEIVFFSSESCGRISFPYEIPIIDLIH